MAKILRKTQKIFGSSAGPNEIAKFGSLAAGAPAFTTDPAVIQSLVEYLEGWVSSVVGFSNPAIEDMNALFYLYAYQLAYIMQAGVSEWDAGTTYYIGSFASDGLGSIYSSKTNNNTGNALSDPTNWTITIAKRFDQIYSSDPGTAAIPHGLSSAPSQFFITQENGTAGEFEPRYINGLVSTNATDVYLLLSLLTIDATHRVRVVLIP